MKVLLFCFIFVFTLALNAKEQVIGYFNETNEVPLEKKVISAINKEYKNGFLMISSKEGLFYFNSNGTLNASYDKRGKGPGEFMSMSNVVVADDDMLFVSDAMLNKIVILKYRSDGIFSYIDEFSVNQGSISSMFFYERHLYAVVHGGKHLISVFDTKGIEITQEIPMTKALFDPMGYECALSGDVVLISSSCTFNLYFFKIQNRKLIPIKETKSVYNHKKGWDSKQGESKGLAAVVSYKDGFFVTFNPMDKTPYRFVEKYDLRGDYQGTIRITNKKTKTMYMGFRFSEDGNKVWYQYLKMTLGIPTKVVSDKVLESTFVPMR